VLYDAPRPALLWRWPYWSAALCVAALTALVVWKRRQWPAGVVLWVFYGVSVAPVAGLVKLGEFATADRYTYLSCLGWALLAGYFLALALRRSSAFSTAALTFAVAICGFLGVLTSGQIAVWRNSETLWRHELHYNPGHVLAENNLGIELASQGRLDEAIAHYAIAIKNTPQSANGYANMGNAFSQKGLVPQAIAAYRDALKWNPASVQAHNNLANLLVGAGQFEEAELHFRAALRYQPSIAAAHFGLATVLRNTHRSEEAAREYAEAQRLNANPR
jgi:tetratricopeptide (TPR) repeat protein